MAYGSNNNEMIKYKKAVSLIKKGDSKLYLLFGEERFLLEDLIKQIKISVLGETENEIDLSVYDGQKISDIDFNKIYMELCTPGFISERRLVIIKNSGLFTAEGKAAGESAENIFTKFAESGSGVLLFYERTVDKRYKKLYKTLEKNGKAIELGHLDSRELLPWIRAYLDRFDIKIDTDAAEYLLMICNNDMTYIRNELSKFKLYAQAEALKKIDLPTVELIGPPDLNSDIFDLTRAFSSGNTEKSMKILDRLRKNREADQKILFMLARQIRLLLCAISTNDAGRLRDLLKLPFFVCSGLIREAEGFSEERLESMYELCLSIDSKIKRGMIEAETGIELLILNFSS